MTPMLNIAIKAARQAGSIINRASFDIALLKSTTIQDKKFINEINKAAEISIIKILKTAYPTHKILTSEASKCKHQRTIHENIWIIDSLNGINNFIHGFQQYCVSIALEQYGKITQAVIYDPIRNDLFIASKGTGAYLNAKRIRVSKCDKMINALIGTNLNMYDTQHYNEYIKLFCLMIKKCNGLRCAGAVALDLAYVANGSLDGFCEIGLKSLDIAAGSLLISEAGGIIGTFKGEAENVYDGNILAGNPKIFSQQVHLLSKFL